MPPRRLACAFDIAVEHSLVLPLGAIVALIWANTAAHSYLRVAHALQFIVNDIGMAFFLAFNFIRVSVQRRRTGTSGVMLFRTGGCAHRLRDAENKHQKGAEEGGHGRALHMMKNDDGKSHYRPPVS